MARVRTFTEDDVAEAVRLFERVYPASRWPSRAACESYFREIFFHNPWRHLELPSWLAEENGSVVGFLGVLPRPMLLGAKPIRAAVSCQFMVDPERRHGLVALQLLRHYFGGPQDIALTDGANEASRRVWQAAGGAFCPLYSLYWLRPLHPARSLLQFMTSRRPNLAPLAGMSTPLARLTDAYAARFTTLRLEPCLDEEALDPVRLLEALEDTVADRSLRPLYDAASLSWLLAQVSAKKHHGALESCLLRQSNGQLAGWFLYYLNPGLSRVVQVGMRPQCAKAVLEHLFYHAWSRGALALEGRIEPRLIGVLGDRHCFLHDQATLALMHAREAATLDPLYRGDAFFTRLEAEWWMRFHRAPEAVREDIVGDPRWRTLHGSKAASP